MKTSEIARKILEVRKRPSPFIMTGELTVLLGPDGFQEALSRRWIIHDSENAAMLVTPLQAFIEHMKTLAEDGDPEVGDSVVVASDGSTYTGTVQSKNGEDYKLSFPPGKGPSRVVPAYKKGEIKKFAQPEQKVQPGSVPVKRLNNQVRQVPQ